ncbi:hypothetical protein [Pseudomonas sp. NPDC090592]|uniref:hypothetical protein n=1 Tax=Pseudomonas sp. NPDC090592 TaxID=3364480 RepID=UPI00383AD5AB
MFLRTAIALVAALLSACGNIQHNTTEARQHIKEDLKLAEITDTSFTSFCWMRIGGPAGCHATPGISVLTPDSLLLVDYEWGKYVKKDIIKPENVRCIHEGNSEIFYVFTDQVAVQVMPLTDVPGSPMVNNARYREEAIKMLLSNGQPYVTREVAPMIVASGVKFYTTMPSGTAGMNVGQIISPCPGAHLSKTSLN